MLPAVVPKGEEVGPELPKGEDETAGFCWLEVPGPEEDEKGEASIVDPLFPKPEDVIGAGGAGVDPRFPNPEEDDEPPVVVAVEFIWADDSCKGFETLYLVESL